MPTSLFDLSRDYQGRLQQQNNIRTTLTSNSDEMQPTNHHRIICLLGFGVLKAPVRRVGNKSCPANANRLSNCCYIAFKALLTLLLISGFTTATSLWGFSSFMDSNCNYCVHLNKASWKWNSVEAIILFQPFRVMKKALEFYSHRL